MAGILDEVGPATRDVLERYGFDPDLFAQLQEGVRTGRIGPRSNTLTGTVEPPPDELIARLPAPGEPGFDDAAGHGRDAIRRGEVAMAVLNGGMATRFGGVVKGIVEAVDGRSFLEWKLAEAARVAAAAGGDVSCVVMNSFATDVPTRTFLAGLGERGAGLPEPLFFNQFVSLRMNPDGSLFRDAAGHASMYGPGHGDFPEALRRSGTLARLRERGVRYLMLSNVDNLGARVDPTVIGMHLRGGRPMTLEVAAKEPGDAGGAPALVNGRLTHVEGPRFPPDFDQDRIRVFNCNSFIFDLDALDREYALPWLYVEKDADGRRAVQVERLVNELTTFLDAQFLEVPRTGPRGRFYPIKAPADLEAARPALRAMLATDLVAG
jgi:UTP--glucose-1-phosphate uridylyltransferase